MPPPAPLPEGSHGLGRELVTGLAIGGSVVGGVALMYGWIYLSAGRMVRKAPPLASQLGSLDDDDAAAALAIARKRAQGRGGRSASFDLVDLREGAHRVLRAKRRAKIGSGKRISMRLSRSNTATARTRESVKYLTKSGMTQNPLADDAAAPLGSKMSASEAAACAKNRRKQRRQEQSPSKGGDSSVNGNGAIEMGVLGVAVDVDNGSEVDSDLASGDEDARSRASSI